MSTQDRPWWKAFTRKVVRIEFDDRALGADRRHYREKFGISLRQFAKAVGFSAPYVVDLELGRRAWSEQLIYRFEAALEECIKARRQPPAQPTPPASPESEVQP